MIETIGAAVAGVVALGYAGIKSRAAAKAKKENELLKEKNARLLKDVFDSINNKITNTHVQHDLRETKKDYHRWVAQSITPYKWSVWSFKGRRRGADSIVHEQCKYCGMVRRRWDKGVGTVDRPKMEGYWFGDNKLKDTDERLVHCPGVVLEKGDD